MALTPTDILAVHGQVRRLQKYSDRLVGLGPFGIGLDGVLAWVPVAGAVYSFGSGAWLLAQAVRVGASPSTFLRMLLYMGFNTATAAMPVPLVGSAIDFLFQGQMMAGNALIKDIERRYPEARPVKGRTAKDGAAGAPAAR